MKVHINQIPPEGKRLEGEESSGILELHEGNPRPTGPIHYVLDVGMSDGGVFATGSLKVDLECQCVSCLEPFRYPVSVDDFACQVEITGRETVDLTDPIREDILLALPPHPHCDWNGERDCKGAFHRAAESDQSSDTREVWGALDQLNIKKKN
jgi:uncharacterized metal-binding protein YceD (DUF177 family)